MSHRFDPKRMSRLDDPERKKNLPPDEILLKLGLRKNDAFLDIGAGTGYFSFPAAEIVGEKGNVTATDVSEEMTAELSRRIIRSERKNMNVLLSQENDFGVAVGSYDMAFLGNVLHEVEDKKKLLVAVRKTLKKDGRIGIVEWKKAVTPGGPPLAERIGVDEILRLLSETGFDNTLWIDWNGLYNLFFARNRQ